MYLWRGNEKWICRSGSHKLFAGPWLCLQFKCPPKSVLMPPLLFAFWAPSLDHSFPALWRWENSGEWGWSISFVADIALKWCHLKQTYYWTCHLAALLAAGSLKKSCWSTLEPPPPQFKRHLFWPSSFTSGRYWFWKLKDRHLCKEFPHNVVCRAIKHWKQPKFPSVGDWLNK